MLYRNRITKKFYDHELLEILGKVTYSVLPKIHNLVDQMHIVCEEKHKKTYEDLLSHCLKKIESFLISTRYYKAKDFREAYINFFSAIPEKDLNKPLTFGLKEQIVRDKTFTGAYMPLSNEIILKESFFNTASKEDVVATLGHEIIHYLTTAFEVRYMDKDRKEVTMPAPNRFGKATDKMYKYSLDTRSGEVQLEDFDKTLYFGTFFLEGFTELMTRIIFPPTDNYNYSYRYNVEMVELMLFATGQKYDLKDFFRLNLETTKKRLGDTKFNKLVGHCELFHKQYIEDKSIEDPQETPHYLSAQKILIDHYIEILKGRYNRTEDVAGFTKDFLELLEYIPIHTPDMYDYFIETRDYIFGSSSNQKFDNLLEEIIKAKTETMGKEFDLTYNNIEVEGILNEFGTLEAIKIGQDYTTKEDLDLFKTGIFKRFKSDDYEYEIGYELGKYYVVQVDQKTEEKKVVFIEHIEEPKPQFIVFDEKYKNKEIKVVDITSKEYLSQLEQNLGFVQHQKAIEEISKKFNPIDCKRIVSLDSWSTYGFNTSKNRYALETFDGEVYFFKRDGRDKIKQVYIEDLVESKNSGQIYDVLSTADKNFLLDRNKTELHEKRYYLDDGIQIGVKYDDNEKPYYMVMNDRYTLSTKNKEIFSGENRKLLCMWSDMLEADERV